MSGCMQRLVMVVIVSFELWGLCLYGLQQLHNCPDLLFHLNMWLLSLETFARLHVCQLTRHVFCLCSCRTFILNCMWATIRDGCDVMDNLLLEKYISHLECNYVCWTGKAPSIWPLPPLPHPPDRPVVWALVVQLQVWSCQHIQIFWMN